jgi:arylsulfatase A-like enzyme
MRIPCSRLAGAALSGLVFVLHCGDARAQATAQQTGATQSRVILFVWDGLRPDGVTPEDTPNLAALASAGVTFADHHATYPTFTMMNAASLATGCFPGKNGFYGNTCYEPGATGKDAAGNPVDFRQPQFTEDYAILRDLDQYHDRKLLLVDTLVETAGRAGLATAVIGKSGPVFLQDRHTCGVVFDEKTLFTLDLARKLLAEKVPLPATTPFAYDPGAIELPPDNGDPTAGAPRRMLPDKATPDPTDASGSPSNADNQYLVRVSLDHLLFGPSPPRLTLIWLRTPDSTEHAYGPGTANYRDGLRAQDALLGQIVTRLAALDLLATTDLLVVSDHGHSTVCGDPRLFPLLPIGDPTTRYSVSGDVRLADLLAREADTKGDKKFEAFDGGAEIFCPVLSGIKADGSPVYPTLYDDAKGTVTGQPHKKYTTPPYRLPQQLPPHALVIAANGGSDYIYVPDHDPQTVRDAVRFLQSREEIGAIFVSDRYGAVAGTLPMSTVNVENAAGRNPDIILSYEYDADAVVSGANGIEYESMANNRGMHGSFSPVDVHNTLIAYGPHWKRGFADPLPTGNVDVAPTIAHILGLTLPDAQGRVLDEALTGGAEPKDFAFRAEEVPCTTATDLKMKLPTSPDGKDDDAAKTTYSIRLKTKVLEH